MAMVLRLEPDLEIIGVAENGRGGLNAAKNLNPENSTRILLESNL